MEQRELEERYLREVSVENSKAVYHEMRDIKNWDKEVIVAFYLDTRNKIISREIVSIGTLNTSVVHPRDSNNKKCMFNNPGAQSSIRNC